MIATFKETITSLQDNKYGQVIIDKPLKVVLWYWTKYLLLIAAFPLLLAIFLFTRYLPEAPKFILDQFPEGTISAKDNQLSSTISQPYKLGNSNFSLILDLGGDVSELDSVQGGVLLLKDKLISKSENGQIQMQTYGQIPNFSLDKHQLSDWITGNRLKLWIGGSTFLLIAGILITSIIWLGYLLTFVLWAIPFWLGGKFALKKTLSYFQSLNLVIYASVLPLLLSFILSLAPNKILDYLRLVLFLFFGISWISNLPGKEAPSFSLLPEIPVLSPPKKSRQTKKLASK
jgi:hypothetical protein